MNFHLRTALAASHECWYLLVLKFVWYKYRYVCFLLVSIYTEHFFPFFHFQTVSVLTSEVCVFIHSATLCLIGEFIQSILIQH